MEVEREKAVGKIGRKVFKIYAGSGQDDAGVYDEGEIKEGLVKRKGRKESVGV